MERKVDLRTSDWIYNVGLLGLHNILKHKNSKFQVTSEGISFDLSELEGLEDAYFNYLIDKYKPTLSIDKITSFEDVINSWENDDYENFTSKSLDRLNNQIDQVKKYVKSNSYKSAYKLLDCQFDPLQKEKELKKINLKKKENIEDKFSDIKEQISILREIIGFFKQEDSQKYIGAKNVIYTLIRNAWDNVSILNRQNKNPNMYDEIANYFIKPAIDYRSSYEEENKKFKYTCMSCNSLIKSLDNDISFINEVGFDVARKSSHLWDHNNYVAICPMCKLVYACMPAGFSYAYSRGLFVNYSRNFREMIRINQQIKSEMDRETNQNTSIYYAIQAAMDRSMNEDMRYELSDVQIVRYFRDMDSGKNSYSFNILNKSIQNVIYNSASELKYIKGAYFEEGNFTVYAYNQVMNSLFNNENQFLLIHKMIHYKVSNPDKTRYNCSQIQSIIKINVKYLEEAGYMFKQEHDYVENAKNSGYYLRQAFKAVGADKKLDGIAYRMLNALKTNNKHAFMDVLIKASMYSNNAVNSVFIKTLEDDLKFKNAGYAFIASMIDKGSKTNKDENKGE